GRRPLFAKTDCPRASHIDLRLEADGVHAGRHVLPEWRAARGVLRPGRGGRRAFGVRGPKVPQGRLRRHSEGHDLPDRLDIAESLVPPDRVDRLDQEEPGFRRCQVDPKGTTYRIDLTSPKAWFLLVESIYPITFAPHYLNKEGQATLMSPVVETEIETPDLPPFKDARGEFPIDVKHGGGKI